MTDKSNKGLTISKYDSNSILLAVDDDNTGEVIYRDLISLKTVDIDYLIKSLFCAIVLSNRVHMNV